MKKTLLSLLGAGLIAGTAILSGGCSREYVKGSTAVKPTQYNEKSKYKESDLILNQNRYVIKKEDKKILGIDQDYTKLNATKKDREWDKEKTFTFYPTNGEIAVGEFKESRRLRKNKKEKINENDYKYNLNDFTTPIKIGGKKYLAKQDGNKLILFEKGKFEEILNEKDGQVYLRNKKGQIGIYVAEMGDWIKTPLTYHTTLKKIDDAYQNQAQPNNTQKYLTRNIRERDTFYSLSKEFNVTIEQLKEWNPNANPNNLKIGSNLNVGILSSK